MIRSIISNLPIGRAHADRRNDLAALQRGDTDYSFDFAKSSTGASQGSAQLKPPQSSEVSKSIAFFEEHLEAYEVATRTDERSASNSTYLDEPTEAYVFLGTGTTEDDGSVSDLSFDALPTDPDEVDSTTMPSFSKELYRSDAWDKESYSLVLLEQQWFRLAKNSGFTTALYLQGLTEVLHTVRGIFQNHPEETLHLVIDDQKTVYKLDRTNYRKGITACCTNALHTMPTEPEFQYCE